MNLKTNNLKRSVIIVFVVLMIIGFTFYSSLYYLHSNSLDNYSSTFHDNEYSKNTHVNSNRKETVCLTKSKVADSISVSHKTSFYLSEQAEGIVGYYHGNEYDNPADNIFNIKIDEPLSHNSKVWISYTLTGLSDFGGVACSVNDRFSFGGHIIKTDSSTSKQRIRINPNWLSKGDNRIKFGIVPGVPFGYKITELAIEVEEVHSNSTDDIVIINSSNKSYSGSTYIHGFMNDCKNAIVKVNSELVEVFDSEFEKIVTTVSDSIIIEVSLPNVQYRKMVKTSKSSSADFIYTNGFNKKANKKLFLPEIEGVLKSELATIGVATGVINDKLQISLSDLRPVDLPAMGLGMSNVTENKKGVRFLPHGEHFSGEGASVALKYDRTLIPDGYTEDDIRTFYFNPISKNWEALERDTVNKELCMVVSKTSHFTDMINGIIQTPESPETQGFAPTMMSDIKAADPASGINLIAPPTANNMGSANLSYPIEILPVKNTVNPNLIIQYNSDAGSGWLGEGWDLSIPKISVDTRWGVPRYDPLYETETYSFNGTMLATMVKDSGSDINNGVVSVGRKGIMYERLNGQVQFHPVSGGNFDLIIREGTNPSNYQWKVTDKSGVTYTYGTDSAVLKGTVNSFEYFTEASVEKKRLVAKEAIAEWHLLKMEDQYGNYCKYNYQLSSQSIIGSSTVKAKEIIPESIIIGRDDTILQTIQFHILPKKKQKKMNSARYGFLTSSNSLLEYIHIYDKNNIPIRKYKFVIDSAEFSADVLSEIFQYDSDNKIVATHTLEYHNNINLNNSRRLFSEVESEVIVPAIDDQIIGDLPALGGNLASSYGGSLYLGGGVGFNTVGIEAGYNGSISVTNNETKALLVDITGDGLPDKLFVKKQNGTYYLYYMKNEGNNLFGSPVNTGFSDKFSTTKTTNSSNGWKGTFNAFNIIGLNAGMDWMNGFSETKAYLLDVNNDGLVDIVNNNIVYFNCISKYENGVPIHSFSINSGFSPSPIINGQTIKRKGTPLKISDLHNSNPIVNIDHTTLIDYIPSRPPISRLPDSLLAEKRLYYENMPLQDVVRVWESPYDGNIKIDSRVKLIGIQNDNTYDGVRVAIQYQGIEYWKKKIHRSDTTNIDTTLFLNVSAGDKIFFRLQSGDEEFCDGSNDVVRWSPVIIYTNRNNTIDVNGYSDSNYCISEGAFVSKLGYNLIDSIETTQVLLKGKFTKPVTSDDITLKVFLTNDSIIYQEILKDTIIYYDGTLDTVSVKRIHQFLNPDYHPKELILSIPFDKDLIVNYDLDVNLKSLIGVNHYRFEIFSSSNVAWDKIKWTPQIIRRANGVDTTIYPGVKYDCYSHVIQNSNFFEMSSVDSVTITPHVLINQNKTINSSFLMILRNNNEILKKKPVSIINNVLSTGSDIKLPNLPWSKYWVEYYLIDTCLNDLHFAAYEVRRGNNPPNYYTPGVYGKKLNYDLGHMWRGWGQFQYNANDGRYALPIQESKLYIPNDTSLSYIQNEWGIKNMRMFSLNPESVKKEYWMGLNDNIFISEDIMCAGRVNVHDLPSIAEHNNTNGALRVNRFSSLNSDSTSDAGASGSPSNINSIELPAIVSGTLYEIQTAPFLSSKHKSKSMWGGASDVLGVLSSTLSKSKSEGSSVITSSYMDMNGDGYPDYVTDTQIEYSNRHGGLDGEIAGYSKNQSGIVEWISGVGTESGILNDVSTSSGISYGFSDGVSWSTPLKTLSSSSTLSLTSKDGSGSLGIQISTLQRSVSLTGEYSGSRNTSSVTNSYMDVNGDGLPDRIFYNGNNVMVCLNLGYSFSEPTDWGVKEVSCISTNLSYGDALSANLSGTSEEGLINIFLNLLNVSDSKEKSRITSKITKGVGLSLGYSQSNSSSYTLYALRDINQDGLIDKIYKNNQGKYAFSLNEGDKFTEIVSLDYITDLFKSVSKSYSASMSVNFRVNLFLMVYLSVGGGGSYSWGSDYICSDLIDIDGDGFADIVKVDDIDKCKLKVRTSQISYTNKLKSVINQFGGSITIDYARSKPSFDHPGGKWIMKSIELNDGVAEDGENFRNEFEYIGGKYDRYEREFLGFAEVISYNIHTVANETNRYRGFKQFFSTQNIYQKGLMTGSSLFEPNEDAPKIYAENININSNYKVKRIASSTNEGKYLLEPVELSPVAMFTNQFIVYSPVKYTKSVSYGFNNTENWIPLTATETYSEYNTNVGTHGELLRFKFSNKGYMGENGSGSYNYMTDIEYLDTLNMSFFCLPRLQTVKDAQGNVCRKTQYYWWPQFASKLKTAIVYLDNNRTATTHFVYDQYGNVLRKTLPANYKNERMWYQYQYDPVYHMFPTKITDAFGYTYEIPEYDYRFGIPLKTIDINGNVMTQRVDNRGRIYKITGPNEYDANDTSKYTIKFAYNPQRIEKIGNTYTQMPYAITQHFDATQLTDKNLETVTFVDGFGRPIQVKKESMVDGTPKMIVSGLARYDAFGRVKETFYPVVDDFTNKTIFNTAFDNSVPPTITTYDVLDRVTKTRLPDNTETNFAYSIIDGLLKTTVIDAKNNKQESFTNGSGLTVKTLQYKHIDPDTVLTTLFEYDDINQLKKVTDDAGKTTESLYDWAGNRTQVKHPASGITNFGYDPAGNTLWKYTANKDSIKYGYEYNRLTTISYPRHPENNVVYTYGLAQTSDNRAGRLVGIEDGSGAQEFKYGRQGEVTEVRRTLVIPNQGVASYVTRTSYDSWNRLLKMTYPDGEEVNYTYNTGGLLTGVSSNATTYVKNILYDKFEQRTQLQYGNGNNGFGAVTTYSYKPTNRFLDQLSVASNGTTIMQNAYAYDDVGNITQIENTGTSVLANKTISGTIGGTMKHTYQYDNLYRLKEAHGVYNNGVTNKNARYDLYMDYDNMHNIVSKKQQISQTGVQFAGSLNAGYELNYTINTDNSQQIANIADESYRYEGTKLETPPAAAVVKKSQHHTYDANGNLIYVASGKLLTDSTLHATNTRKLLWDEENRLLALSDNGYVSNYWYDAAGERTVKESFDSEGVYVNGVLSGARTGTNKFTAYVSPYLVVSNGGNYTKHIYMGSQRITSKLSNSGIFTSRNPLTDTTALNKSYTAKLASFTGKIKERFDSLGVNYNGTPQTGGLVSSNPVSTASSYFYHSDHLGSSSLITDGTGALVQHIEYVPFGETFIDERNGSWSTPYLFNGKEKDEETGLHYYGARYYDSRLGVWLSVDPLAEKYPNWSSYVYTFNCPVNYTDPDGKKPMKGRWVHLSETKHYNNYPALAYSQQFIPEDKYINSQFFFVRLNSGLNLSISPDRKASINVPGHKEWYPIDINKLSRGGCLSCEISALAMAISFEIADDVVKYGIPALTMLGGAIAIATLAQSGGGSVSGFKAFRMLLTALSGSWAVVGGSVKLMLNIQGNTDLANIIPTDFLNATIGIICETTINDKKTLQIIRGTLSMINGVATFSAPDTQLEAISNVSNIYGIIDGAGNLINIKNE